MSQFTARGGKVNTMAQRGEISSQNTSESGNGSQRGNKNRRGGKRGKRGGGSVNSESRNTENTSDTTSNNNSGSNANKGNNSNRGKGRYTLKKGKNKTGSEEGNSGDKNNNRNGNRKKSDNLNRDKYTKKDNKKVLNKDEKHAGNCVVCFGDLSIFAVTECGHRDVCKDCSVRLRDVYKNYSCPVCMTELDYVIISDDPLLEFKDYDVSELLYHEEARMYIVSEENYSQIQSTKDFICSKCSRSFNSILSLKNHMRDAHQSYFCVTCLEKKNCFLNEQIIYTQQELQKHSKFGEPEKGIKPHPVCKFCPSEPIYDEEDLFNHCSQLHLTCFLCDRNLVPWQYFRNYPHLEQHLADEHYLCPDENCKREKLIAFESELEYRVHLLKRHKDQLSKEDIDDLRRVDVSFNLKRNNIRPPPVREENSPSTNNYSNTTNTTNAPKPYSMSTQGREEGLRQLNARITELISPEDKKTFNRASVKYKDSEIRADTFFGIFTKIFGTNDQALQIFEQMVELLPNAKKQRELRSIIDRDQDFPELMGVNSDGSTFTAVSYDSLVTRNSRSLQTQDFPSLSTNTPPPQPRSSGNQRSYANPNRIDRNFPGLPGNSLTSLKAKNPKPKQQKQRSQPQKKNIQNEFPTLGGQSPPSQVRQQTQNEFPSLGGNTSRTPLGGEPIQAEAYPSLTSQKIPQKTNQPRKKKTPPKDDFPSLGGTTRSPDPPSWNFNTPPVTDPNLGGLNAFVVNNSNNRNRNKKKKNNQENKYSL